MKAQLFQLIGIWAVVGQAAKITFFEHSGFQGESLSLDYEGLGCYNLPSNWNDKASSISTHDNCFIVYEHAGCTGRSERIAPGTHSHGHLADLGFNDMITSYHQCPPSENTCRAVSIDMDTSRAPELQQFGNRVKQLLEQWYPYICRLLHSETYYEPERIKVILDPDYNGVAEAAYWSKEITGSVNYYRDHQDDLGSMIHEMAHILQQYAYGECPGWLVEGIADSARRWHYESEKPGKPKPNENYRDHGAVYFLNWIDARYPNTLYRVNRNCRDRVYSKDDDSDFVKFTGKNLDQLWDQMMRE